jgi:hypothetical protein
MNKPLRGIKHVYCRINGFFLTLGPAHEDASQARATVNIRLPLPRMLRPMTSMTGRAGHGSRKVGNKVETPLGAAG